MAESGLLLMRKQDWGAPARALLRGAGASGGGRLIGGCWVGSGWGLGVGIRSRPDATDNNRVNTGSG